MNIQLTVSLSPETLTAINGLADAVRSVGGVSVAAEHAAVSNDTPSEGPIYWIDTESGTHGIAETLSAYNAQKKKTPGAFKVPADLYEGKVEELTSKKEEAAAAEKEAAAKAAAEKKEAAAAKKEAAAAAKKEAAAAAKKEAAAKAAAEKKEAAGADEVAIPTEDDLIAAFQEYLPKSLSKEERAERHQFVKPLLQRFGVARATELAEEHRALAINLVLRKNAGEDVDPETAEYQAFDAEDVI